MNLNLFLDFISESVKEINADVEKLYSNKYNNKRKVLDHLKSEIMTLDNYIKHFSTTNQLRMNDTSAQYTSTFTQQAVPVVNDTKTYTKEELARFNGKNGNPAYVAVNGVIYDVTNNAAWAAASHFGLSAGNDLTSSFAACHAGTDILNRLPVVGNLI